MGVAEKKGAILGQSQDEFAIVPLGAFQKIFGSRQSLQLTVTPTDPSFTQDGDGRRDRGDADSAPAAARRTRTISASCPPTRSSISTTRSRLGIFAILIGVVSLSLVVGGIVIMNIMLMVVTERTREIGLRKSLGARRRDILWQILTESITLSTFGGIIGTVLGFLVAKIISMVSPLPAIVEVWSVVLGISMTAGRRAVLRPVSGHARGAARSDRSAAAGVVELMRWSLFDEIVRDVLGHAPGQQVAVRPDGARRRHRHHVDRRA